MSDERDFGRIQEMVDNLVKGQLELKIKVDLLLERSNMTRGGVWLAGVILAMSGAISGTVIWLYRMLSNNKP